MISKSQTGESRGNPSYPQEAPSPMEGKNDTSDKTTIFTDHQGREIRLTGERRAHVLDHPEMAGQLDRIRETLAEPERVVAAPADSTVHVYHRHYDQTPVTEKFLLVAVKMLADDAYVLTAFFSSRPKRGDVIWPE
jgi:hypothetical protein